MNMLNSIEYYVARERRERDLADAASNSIIAAVHREMADRYAQIIASARAAPEDPEPIKLMHNTRQAE